MTQVPRRHPTSARRPEVPGHPPRRVLHEAVLHVSALRDEPDGRHREHLDHLLGEGLHAQVIACAFNTDQNAVQRLVLTDARLEIRRRHPHDRPGSRGRGQNPFRHVVQFPVANANPGSTAARVGLERERPGDHARAEDAWPHGNEFHRAQARDLRHERVTLDRHGAGAHIAASIGPDEPLESADRRPDRHRFRDRLAELSGPSGG